MLIHLYFDKSCGEANQNFFKEGWFAVEAGQTIVPNIPSLEGDLRNVNGIAYFFAQQYSGSEGATWSGNGNAWTFVPNGAAFGQCFEDNRITQQQVDFIEIEFDGYPNVTVQFSYGAELFIIKSMTPF
jgi:hypothetical protein